MKITVNDLQGSVILDEKLDSGTSEFSISTERFEKGVYILNIHTTGKIIARRLIVLD
jgi:hypothetical protein